MITTDRWIASRPGMPLAMTTRKVAVVLAVIGGTCAAPGDLFAQRDVRFVGTVRSWDRDSAATGIELIATDTADAGMVVHGTCTEHGKCTAHLPLDHVFRVELRAARHVPQHVLVDLNGPTIKQRKWGYRMRMGMELMPWSPDVDYAICGKPLGLAHFDARNNAFTWDDAYSADMDQPYDVLRNAYLDKKRAADQMMR